MLVLKFYKTYLLSESSKPANVLNPDEPLICNPYYITAFKEGSISNVLRIVYPAAFYKTVVKGKKFKTSPSSFLK